MGGGLNTKTLENNNCDHNILSIQELDSGNDAKEGWEGRGHWNVNNALVCKVLLTCFPHIMA